MNLKLLVEITAGEFQKPTDDVSVVLATVIVARWWVVISGKTSGNNCWIRASDSYRLIYLELNHTFLALAGQNPVYPPPFGHAWVCEVWSTFLVKASQQNGGQLPGNCAVERGKLSACALFNGTFYSDILRANRYCIIAIARGKTRACENSCTVSLFFWTWTHFMRPSNSATIQL